VAPPLTQSSFSKDSFLLQKKEKRIGFTNVFLCDVLIKGTEMSNPADELLTLTKGALLMV
jgi:hypothetical protein